MKDCTVYKTVDYISKRWSLVILLELYKGKMNKKRFSEIKKRIPGITPKILSARLKELEKNDMIKKRIDSTKIPIKVEYSLTRKGEDFIKIIKSIKEWSLKWNFQDKICSEQNCKDCIR